MNHLPTPDEMPEPLAGLLRDHEQVAAVVADARATFDGAVLPGARPEVAARVLDVARALQRFLARDLSVHIAKEEEVLFPALRRLAEDMDDSVQHMVAQHDEIRARRDLIDRTMAALDAHRNEIEVERDAFVSDVGRTARGLTPELLAALRERSMRLERILLGHFAEEEEDLFVPAMTLLSRDVLDDLSIRMATLARTGPAA